MSLEGKVALITGAGGMHGIGRAIALRLANLGADIVISDIQRKPETFPDEERDAAWKGIESVKAEIGKLGRRCSAIDCDLTREEEIAKLIDETVNQLGGLHILVNNARAIMGLDQVAVVDLPSSEWDRVMGVNARGTYLCCKYGAAQMIRQGEGGRVINISSKAGKKGSPRRAAYSASKFAIIGLTRSLVHELAPHNITVNAVCPGATDTHRQNSVESELAREQGITHEELRQRIFQQWVKVIPMGRVAAPEDVATVVGFLASPEAGYLTGESINVSGGEVMY